MNIMLLVDIQPYNSELSNELAPRSSMFLQKLIFIQLAKEFPALLGMRNFIIVFETVRHLSVSWANPVYAFSTDIL